MYKTYGSGNAAKGVRILLADSTGKTQAYTYVNNTGYFTFSNLAEGKYKMLADLLEIDNSIAPEVRITGSNPFQSNLSFTHYRTFMQLNTIPVVNSAKDDFLTIFPNPLLIF